MVENIRLQQFRSYSDELFEFEAGVNIIVGPNGSGKTNLLEAILVVATGSSYRAGDLELIQLDKPWARLDATNGTHSRTVKLIKDNKFTKSYEIEGKTYKRLPLQRTLPIVLFEPNHLLLLTGQPELRRNYLDGLLEQTRPGYGMTLRHFRRVLQQRNALLKSTRTLSPEQLFVWNLRMSELGAVIARARYELVNDMNKELPSLYEAIAGSKKSKLTINYLFKIKPEHYETQLLKGLEQTYERDLERGFTSLGPHREDFVVGFNGRPAWEVASRGEIRTALLALKVYEVQLLERVREQKPILLLDDVFSELDGRRRHMLSSLLESHQTFITTTDADLVLDKKMQKVNILPLINTA